MSQEPKYRKSCPPFELRDARADDATRIAEIYGYYVVEEAGTFEEVAPTSEEIQRRQRNVKARGLPWIVATIADEVVGYCYASPYHTRSAYKFTAQTSLYVDRAWLRQGIGLALINAVADICEQKGYRQIISAVGDSKHEAALMLHAKAGYRTIGHAVRVGMKFGRWVDVVYLQRAIGNPDEPPLAVGPVGYLPPSDQTGP